MSWIELNFTFRLIGLESVMWRDIGTACTNRDLVGYPRQAFYLGGFALLGSLRLQGTFCEISNVAQCCSFCFGSSAHVSLKVVCAVQVLETLRSA